MKLDCKIVAIVEDCGDLSISLRGWAETDPAGTIERDMGTLTFPADDRRRRAFHLGRRLEIEVKARKR